MSRSRSSSQCGCQDRRHCVGLGYNDKANFVMSTTTNRTSAGTVLGLSGVVAVAAGYVHTVAVKDDRSVCGLAGSNASGQLGDNPHESDDLVILTLNNVLQLSANYNHTVAVKDDGTVWAWGSNALGLLGDGTNVLFRTSPVQVAGLSGVVTVAAGYQHTVAVKDDGTVWAWGYNNYGQLGDGTTVTRTTPVQVSGLTNVVGVSTRFQHTVGLKGDGTIWTWGQNNFGQLGDGTVTSQLIPAQVLVSALWLLSLQVPLTRLHSRATVQSGAGEGTTMANLATVPQVSALIQRLP